MDERTVKDALKKLVESYLPLDAKVILLLGLFYLTVQENLSKELRVEILEELSKIYQEYKKVKKELEFIRRATGDGFPVGMQEHIS